ncbi:hypothetical protein A2454_04295 [Candidatus Peribacteria bacterium RIFOXYC2_FULL_55_14]|nr:MAG: hypothetical protein UY85_C0024G0008 [Candidatus Peribacteria bacterium GW2011_GWB1_54_5]OGJ70933.1 MAG: hypothetical protein A2198_00815 [Candidatus Peribacteria bacterium RIFOXYA1_FULL_56_14]OGJ74228.1 MAG: hypothetical protein A2384_05850 [Candidatus Peribacteria bacterium RIFOXYB1_FULL_54_35]OGJ75238.1 MAG: hypothetical protein A2217_05950 [Candidatus Peribacteria bacterium RIFOXYA2_FULL_55_28]OGJ75845.1 MAG: hypothetical protein A2327_02995 [Candidatus Peribacteria bacterium RIFOXY
MVPVEASTGPDRSLDFEAAALNIQREAAGRAATISQFQTNFHTFAQDALEGRVTVSFIPQSDEATTTVTGTEYTADVSASGMEGTKAAVTVTDLAEEQQAEFRAVLDAHEGRVITPATDAIGNLGVEEMPEGQLGEAEIGGRGRVSKGMLAGMSGSVDAKQANHAGKHEQGHMDSVHLSGNLVVDGQVEVTRTLYESYAELTGNRGVGEGVHYNRPGQPEDYAHAQKVGVILEEAVGRAVYEQTLTKDGDVGRLQAALDARGRGRTAQQVREGVGEAALTA